MAVEEKEDLKGRRKREVKNVSGRGDGAAAEIWTPPVSPAYVTVDDLSFYRKKRRPNSGKLKDNLKIEEGSFSHIKSEYRRRFKNFYEALRILNKNVDLSCINQIIKPESSIKLEETKKLQSEYDESFNRNILQRSNVPSERIMNEVSENEVPNRFQPLEDLISKAPHRHLYRRPTNLKSEGEFYHLTEYTEEFIEYLFAKRAELCRTPTTLKLGTGEMDSKTETTDQFIKYENMERPTLCRKFTNLHLEGDLDNKTEKQEKFLPFEVHPRSPLIKKSTNLHLEGEHFLVPEYRHQYVKYLNPERSGLILPSHNLKSARLFEDTSSDLKTFGRISPLIPFLRESTSQYDLVDKNIRRSNSSTRYQSNVSLNRTSSHPNLVKSAISDERKAKLKTPQKNAYLDFDREQNLSLDRGKTRRSSGMHNVMEDGELFGQPENKSAFTDFPRERPTVRRSESNFAKGGQVDYVTEKSDKYRTYMPLERTQLQRRKSGQIFDDPFEKQIETDTAFEGPFECQPEYRKAYIDYLIREKRPPLQKRKILEIPDININDETVNDTSSPSDNKEKTKPTSREERPKSSLQKPSSSSSSVPSSPQTHPPISGPKKVSSSKEDSGTQRRSPDNRQRVFRRSLTPSPVPPDRTSRTPSPKLGGNWRRHRFRESAALGVDKPNIWNSMEADPAFFVLNGGVPSRKSIRNDLYKEEKWMPSWYNGGQ